jgi:4-hydroxymandelate synthase
MNVGAIDHLEFYVEDVDRSVSHLCAAYGFRVAGQGGPESGLDGCRSVLLRQGHIAVLLTSALGDRHPAAEYVRLHGDGVAVVGMTVEDAAGAFTVAVERGAAPVAPPAVLGGAGEQVTFASVTGFGDVAHRFVSRQAPAGPFAPGVIEETRPGPEPGGLLQAVDHLAVCVPAGELDPAVRRYQEVFGFSQTFEELIQVGQQAMVSKVVQSPSGEITFTILEPDTTRPPGQIDEFVRSHGGAGVQHVAFLTSDIAAAVRTVRSRGVNFLTTPASYYDALPARLGSVGVPVATLRELHVLADRDHWGVMLQIFTESRHPRGTFFYELIDRRGARTFGSKNIQALYEAIERQRIADQALRA